MMTGRGILKAPGPKRKKEGDNGAHEPKRVRMGGLTEHRMEDTMEEAPLDEALEAEDLETRKPRRGAVKTSGFESDDENVEEKHGEEDTEEEDSGDEVEEAPGRLLSRSVPSLGESDACDTDKNAEEEEDMFGDSFTAPDKKAKKNKTLTAIEGQEWNPEARDYTDDGTKIEPFNMDQELEEGHFDAEGMYIRKSDQLAMHDKWLQGLTATEIEKAKQAHEKQVAREKADDAFMEDTLSKDPHAIWAALLGYLQPGETLVRALKRWGGNQKAVPKWKLKKSKKSQEGQVVSEQDATKIAHDKKCVEEMTVLSDQLMSIGHFDVYDATYEDVVRKLAKAGYIPQGWTPGTPLPSTNGSGKTAMITSPSSSTYEFKWGNDATEIHGPYSAADMTAWKDSGYFDQEQKPWIRQTETGANFVEYNGSMTFIAF